MERLVAARLVARGFTEAAEGAPAVYTVQCAYAVRPLAVGAYVPGAAPADPPKAVLATATKPRSWPARKAQAYSLVVDFGDAATGRAVYQVRAAGLARIDRAAGEPALLVAAALERAPL